ncbi:hypothetical protein DN730_08050 [Marinomonas piezotolerans]|uniref:Uncharacterized protein n=1 Tax=Marinomonas piezotolerans TaxID=2213058 RepID=A0A370U978_9GAMM|nr:hypothetical protein [Marinomonas piezotolerans]RDL44346.1 hypothetical protein DN730_08050 [Marinomonas piezotolerans]
MKYLSARQMCHDAFYIRSSNDAVLEMQRSNPNILRRKPVMNETDTRGPASNMSKVQHQVMAGKVQHVISQLPPHLQQLALYCWAPRSESMPTYKKQNEFMQYINAQVKEQFTEHYARNTSDVSILIIQILKYERAREEGRQQPPLDYVLAGALAQPKHTVRQRWHDVITMIRKHVREYINAQPSVAPETLLSLMNAVEYDEKKMGKVFVLGDLAIRDFAHRDQAYLFSAGDKEREAVVPVGPLYTDEYLSWRVGTARSNWKRDWASTYQQMISVLNNMAGQALKPISYLKR